METNHVATDKALLGTTLEGRYRVDAFLARGGMSSVYRGLDLRLDRSVAIKVMEPTFAGDRSFIERFELEARAAAKLHHPCVVDVHDQGVDGDHVYLVMELVEGGTLRDLLRAHGALPVPVACNVLDSVLSALAAAHRAGLVHRDVKPENVLIGPGGVVKVADFGLVRAVASAGTTSDSMILGTVAYLSPEQVTSGAAEPSSDVYATGIMLYEMLTGAPPYQADTPLSVAYRHVNDDVPPPSETTPTIPAAVDDLVLRATRRDPALRPADASAFLIELARTRGSLGIPWAPVPVPEPKRAEDTTVIGGESHAATEVVPVPPITPLIASGLPTAEQTAPAHMFAMGPRGTRALSRTELGPTGLNPAGSHPAGLSPVSVGPVSFGPTVGMIDPPSDPLADPFRRQRSRDRRSVLIWSSVVLVLATAIGITSWWLGSGRWITVPAVAGMDPVSAQNALRQAGLNPTISQSYDNVAPPGQVIKTDPGQGSHALRGADITLVVSKGHPVVPDIVPGATPDAVAHTIQGSQLTPQTDANADVYDDAVPAGTVVRLSPPPGTRLDVNAPVIMVISRGPAPKPLPSVVGMPHDQAFAALTAAGFQPYDEPAEFSDQVNGGSVVRTDPPAGTTIAPGSSRRVGVVVSTAVTVPNLVGQSAANATRTLRGMKLREEVRKFSTSGGNGTVIAQSPAPGTRVPPGTAVTIVVFP